MKTNGLCFNPDKICESETMNHPLAYYRRKMWMDEQDRKKSEGGRPSEGQTGGQ